MLEATGNGDPRDAFVRTEPARGARVWHRREHPLGVDAFDPGGWAQVRAASAGRGNAWFVSDGSSELVLRHYLRGGKAALISRDRYLFTGLERTRAWRELHLLQQLYGAGLPVPEPVGALVQRGVLTYRAALLTRAVDGAVSLGQRLRDGSLTAEHLQAVGRCVQRFHASGVWHADLNANNVLFAADQTVYLIDFDRGRHRGPGEHFAGNLARLKRSLDKLSRQGGAAAFDAQLWAAFERGYS